MSPAGFAYRAAIETVRPDLAGRLGTTPQTHPARPATTPGRAQLETPQMTTTDAQPTAIAIHRPNPEIGPSGIQIQTFDDVVRLASAVHKSGLAPKSMKSPEAIATVMLTGLELNLSPMQSLQGIICINGRTGLLGDTALALARSSGLLEFFSETFEGKDDGYAAVCRVKRAGEPEHVSKFSVADAKRARLWGGAGPWTQYPQRMLKYRARGFGLRDVFGDILRGLKTAEELADYADVPRTEAAAVVDTTATEVQEAPPAPEPAPPAEPVTVPVSEPVPAADAV